MDYLILVVLNEPYFKRHSRRNIFFKIIFFITYKRGKCFALELSNDLILVILCKIKLLSTLGERMKEKTFNHGNPFNIDTNEHTRFIENELNQDICSKFWISKNFTFIDVFMENLDDLKANELLIKKILNLNER